MKTILQVVDPDGQVAAELPLDDSRVEIVSAPGHTYRVVVREDGEAAVASNGPRAIRIDDDLIIDQVPSGYPVQLTDFFKACPADQLCTLEIAMPGKPVASLTPANEPLAAYADGGFLMYASQSEVASGPAIPTPPEAESNFNWRPAAALAGTLAIIAGVSGGSSDSAADATAPVAPSLDTGLSTNTPTPVFSGTAEPGSTIALTLSIGASGQNLVRYSTVADASGNWSISTLADVPSSGAFPATGIPSDQPSAVSIVATDPSGNVSTVTSGSVSVDTTAPDRPAIENDGDLSPSTSASLDGIPVINRAEAADGVILDGTAEAGTLIRIQMSGANGYIFSDETITDANGRFSVPVSASELPAEASNVTLTVSAVDAAGNVSVPFQSPLLVDQDISSAAVGISSVTDNVAPGAGPVENGGTTNDTTPTVNGTITGALAADESIQVLRNGQPLGTATVDGAVWSFRDNLNGAESGPVGQFTYTAQVIDYAGNTGNAGLADALSPALTIALDTTAPSQRVTVSEVLDDSGVNDIVIARGGSSTDTTPQITVDLSDVLEAGEVLQLLRTQGGVIEVVGEAGSAGAELSFAFSDTVAAGSAVTYQAQVIDAAGLAGIPSTVYVVSITDPLNNLP